MANQGFNDLAWLDWQVMIGSIQAGLAISWCWATMALVGRSRPSPAGSTDWAASLGSTWIAFALLFAYANLSKFYL